MQSLMTDVHHSQIKQNKRKKKAFGSSEPIYLIEDLK